MKKTNRTSQRGSVGGWIIIILIVGGGVSMGSKLIPLYMDHNTMESVLDKLATEEGVALKSDTAIRDMLKKRFRLNNIRDFAVDDLVEVVRSGRGAEVVLDYEVRLPMIANLDVIASFEKSIELKD